jgi:hypothetical protein
MQNVRRHWIFTSAFCIQYSAFCISIVLSGSPLTLTLSPEYWEEGIREPTGECRTGKVYYVVDVELCD